MSTIVPASFNVSVGGFLQSFLNENTSTTAAGGVLGALQSGGSSNSSSVFGLLQNAGSSGAGATTAALSTGAVKVNEQKVVAAIANAPNGQLTQAWNSNGTEPSTLTSLRSYGWIKLTGRTYDASTKTYSGTYVLTPVGNAINVRTGGGSVTAGSSGALSSSTLNGTTGSGTLSSAQSAAIVSILTSLGLATTSSTPTVGSTPTTSSSSTTGTVVSLLA